MLTKFRRVAHNVHRQSWLLVAIFVLSLGHSALSALQPWPLKLLVDHALGEAAVPGIAGVLVALRIPTKMTGVSGWR